MVYSSGETEVERTYKYAQRELDFLYDELDRVNRRWQLVAWSVGILAFVIGFVVGVEFVLYKVF